MRQSGAEIPEFDIPGRLELSGDLKALRSRNTAGRAGRGQEHLIKFLNAESADG